MKKNHAPQPEFGFTKEPMKLVSETGTDGDRVAADQRDKEKAQRNQARAQWWFKQMHQIVENAPEHKRNEN